MRRIGSEERETLLNYQGPDVLIAIELVPGMRLANQKAIVVMLLPRSTYRPAPYTYCGRAASAHLPDSTLAVSSVGLQFEATDPPSMYIETRTLGRKARPLDGWAIPDPPIDRDGEGNRLTLRELIARVVRTEVAAFEHRERARRFVRVLSDAEIADGAARGRVDPGGRPATGPVDVEQAVGAALQGFEDGLYLIVLDGIEQRELDREVFIKPDSKLVFLRLTFLAGA